MIPLMLPTVGLIGRRRFGKIAVHEFSSNTATGSQTLLVPGWSSTPTAAIVMVSNTTITDGVAGAANESHGFCTAAASRCSTYFTLSASTTALYRSASSTNVIRLIDTAGGGNTYLRANFTAFVPGGMTINIVENEYAAAYRISVIFFVAANATVGHFSGASGSVSLGYQPSAIFTAAAYGVPFNDTFQTGVANSRGFVSYDGTTTRQRQIYYGVYSGSPRQTDGFVSSQAAQGCSITGGASGFSYTLSDTNVTPGYLALNGFDAWAGHDDSPTATGIEPFPTASGPSWTPELALLMPTTATAYSTNQTGGFAVGFSAMTVDAQLGRSAAAQDNSASPADYNAAYAEAMALLNVSGGTLMNRGKFAGFDAGKVNINYSAANATARFMAGMLMKAA